MKEAEAIQKIKDLLEAANNVCYGDNSLRSWRYSCGATLDQIFGKGCEQTKWLFAVSFEPWSPRLDCGDAPNRQAFHDGMQESKKLLSAFIADIEAGRMPGPTPKPRWVSIPKAKLNEHPLLR